MSSEAVGPPQNLVGPEFRKLHTALGKDVRPAFPHMVEPKVAVCLCPEEKNNIYSVYRKTSSYPKLPPLDFCGLQLLFNYL
jgi:hypothetical protein